MIFLIKGSIVRAIVTKKTKDKPRSFFDSMDKWAKDEGASGLAYFTIEKEGEIIIHQASRMPFGSLFIEGYSLIVWAPC